jgi:hypothetical protein
MANKAILKKTETKFMARIPQQEIIGAMKELSSGAYKLLMYYYSRRDGWEFIDENIANAIGTSPRQVKKFRKELIDTKYLLIQKGSIDVYFIGKLSVEKFLSPTHDTTVDDETHEPLVTSTSKTTRN